MSIIIDAQYYAKRAKSKSVAEWMKGNAVRRGWQWSGETCDSEVFAEINWGRWIVNCECGGAEVVAQDYAWFFCCSCGNSETGGALRPVSFPENAEKIVAELEKRKGKLKDGIIAPSRGHLPRDWKQGETVIKLKQEREARHGD